MALLPLVEMGTAPPIVPGYDMLRPMNRFTRRHVELDNCSCPIAEHSRTMALIELSCACKRTDCLVNPWLAVLLGRPFLDMVFSALDCSHDDYHALFVLCLLYAVSHSQGESQPGGFLGKRYRKNRVTTSSINIYATDSANVYIRGTGRP